MLGLPRRLGHGEEAELVEHLGEFRARIARASSYISFALAVLVAVGVVFELPVVILTFVRLGLVSSRALRRDRRLGYVAVTALAVALPGIDPVATALELVPLLVLFEGSIWLSVVCERRWRREAARASTLPA